MSVHFQRITPTPTYSNGVTISSFATFSWTDRFAVVKRFKNKLKRELRTLQLAQCCFCRRQLSDDVAVHLEHFVDKGLYGAYSFEIRNLALACGTCNGAKNGHTLHVLAKLKKRAMRNGKPYTHRCLALSEALPMGEPYPMTHDQFRWVHPHVDNFSDHIELVRGWVYTRKTLKGYRTIRSANLNQIAALERRAADERVAARGDDVLSALASQFPDLQDDDLQDVASILANRIRERKNSLKS